MEVLKANNLSHGGDIYSYPDFLDFSANINPFGPGQAVWKAAIEGVLEMDHYPDPDCRRLRSALAEKLSVPESWLIFGNGAADLIFSLVLAEKPRCAVLAAPSFSEYAQALHTVDCEIRYYRLKESRYFDLEEDYLEKLTEDVDLVFLCSPNNPTGRVLNRRLLEQILTVCGMRGIRVVLDVCFEDFIEKSGSERLESLVKKYPGLVLLRAFTKMYAMPGLRLGYAVSGDRALCERLREVRQPWCVSGVAQAAGMAALEEEERVKKTRKLLAKERRWMEQEMKKIGLFYIPSEVNYILFRSPLNVFAALQEYKILIRDCSNYEGLGKGYYRTAVRTRKENQKLIDALQAIHEKDKRGRGNTWQNLL